MMLSIKKHSLDSHGFDLDPGSGANNPEFRIDFLSRTRPGAQSLPWTVELGPVDGRLAHAVRMAVDGPDRPLGTRVDVPFVDGRASHGRTSLLRLFTHSTSGPQFDIKPQQPLACTLTVLE
jgi:hypothetical protein